MNSKTDINELLAKHFANERLTASQQEELNEWISAHRDEYRRLQKLIGASVGKPKGISFDAERAWQKVEAQLEERSQKVIPFRRKMLFWTSMAASLLIVLAVSMFYFSSASDEEMVRYANVGRTEQHCLLPDSSEVILYPEAGQENYLYFSSIVVDPDHRKAGGDGCIPRRTFRRRTASDCWCAGKPFGTPFCQSHP